MANITDSINILLLDDDCSLLEVSKLVLSDIDTRFHIEITSDLTMAFKKIGEMRYDVIVCDYGMPGKNGLQFFEELKNTNKNINFILFTGNDREEIAIQALNLGAKGCINKHGDPETVYRELAHTIKACINDDKRPLLLTS